METKINTEDIATYPTSVVDLHKQLKEYLIEGLKSVGILPEHVEELEKNSQKDPLVLLAAPTQRTQSPDVVQGDLALHCYPFVKLLKVPNPEEAAKTIAKALTSQPNPLIDAVGSDEKGHLHLRLKIHPLAIAAIGDWLKPKPKETKGRLVIEFSSPNTNKPQHLGHVRNNCIGDSVSRLLKEAGYDVHKVNLINDRGIHICKSMLAYKKYGGGDTPQSTGTKGDHFVGSYYVKYENLFREEYKAWLASEEGQQEFTKWAESAEGKRDIAKQKEVNTKTLKAIEQEKATMSKKALQREQERKKRKEQRMKKKATAKVAPSENSEKEDEEREEKAEAEAKRADEIKLQKLAARIKDEKKLYEEHYSDTFFNNQSQLGAETKKMLVDWEHGDEEVRKLWELMNGWVLEGFKETYNTLGIVFDNIDLESLTYLSGKELVQEALHKGILSKLEDGTIVCDLTKAGVPNASKMKNPYKALLRSDGTSVYMTQDLGTAVQRFEKYNADKMIYVVANEQNTHFAELFKILSLIRPELTDKCHHLSYGMVYLPEGRMKSREGKIVEADDLVVEVTEMAEAAPKKGWPGLSAEEIHHRARKIALAAIKYLILSHHPDTTITFDPEKSLQMNGNTGPYQLYAYARTRSILRKAGTEAAVYDLSVLSPEAVKAMLGYLGKLGTDRERQLLNQLCQLSLEIDLAAAAYDPAKVADTLFPLTKNFSFFFQEEKKEEGKEKEEKKEKEKEEEGQQKKKKREKVHPIASCPDPELKQARLLLTCAVGTAVQKCLHLMGIETLEAM